MLALGTTRPDEALDEVAAELRQRQIRGTVVFDLLLANASHARRYYAVEFDGERFAPLRFTRLPPEEGLHRLSSGALVERRSMLDTQLLSPEMRNALNRDLAL